MKGANQKASLGFEVENETMANFEEASLKYIKYRKIAQTRRNFFTVKSILHFLVERSDKMNITVSYSQFTGYLYHLNQVDTLMISCDLRPNITIK